MCYVAIHTAVAIRAVVEEILSEWEIPNTKLCHCCSADMAMMLRDSEEDESNNNEENKDERREP